MKIKNIVIGAIGCILLSGQIACNKESSKIDRKDLVTRHNLLIKDRHLLYGPTQVGNGGFAFGFDITGLQTFSKSNTASIFALCMKYRIRSKL